LTVVFYLQNDWLPQGSNNPKDEISLGKPKPVRPYSAYLMRVDLDGTNGRRERLRDWPSQRPASSLGIRTGYRG